MLPSWLTSPAPPLHQSHENLRCGGAVRGLNCGGAAECTFSRAIRVPAGDYYMMGDNRGDSDDSRYWGPVPQRYIIGVAFFTYWPPDRIGVL